jgi:hypothetical protein
MKSVLNVLTLNILILIGLQLQAQSNPPQDSMLQKIAAALPVGWEMHDYGSVLKIEEMDSVWIIFSNHINGPGRPLDYKKPTDAELKARCQQYGQLRDVAITYRVEPKWDAQRYAQAEAYNDSLLAVARKLYRQRNIQRMNKAAIKHGKSWEGSSYYPKSKADTLALQKFMKGMDRLMKYEKKFPSVCTEKYSLLRLDYDSGYGDILTDLRDDEIYPARVLDEFYAIIDKMNADCDCDP